MLHDNLGGVGRFWNALRNRKSCSISGLTVLLMIIGTTGICCMTWYGSSWRKRQDGLMHNQSDYQKISQDGQGLFVPHVCRQPCDIRPWLWIGRLIRMAQGSPKMRAVLEDTISPICAPTTVFPQMYPSQNAFKMWLLVRIHREPNFARAKHLLQST